MFWRLCFSFPPKFENRTRSDAYVANAFPLFFVAQIGGCRRQQRTTPNNTITNVATHCHCYPEGENHLDLVQRHTARYLELRQNDEKGFLGWLLYCLDSFSNSCCCRRQLALFPHGWRICHGDGFDDSGSVEETFHCASSGNRRR